MKLKVRRREVAVRITVFSELQLLAASPFQLGKTEKTVSLAQAVYFVVSRELHGQVQVFWHIP